MSAVAMITFDHMYAYYVAQNHEREDAARMAMADDLLFGGIDADSIRFDEEGDLIDSGSLLAVGEGAVVNAAEAGDDDAVPALMSDEELRGASEENGPLAEAVEGGDLIGAEDGENGEDRNEVFHVEYPLNRCSSLMRRPSDHKRLADASTDARRCVKSS